MELSKKIAWTETLSKANLQVGEHITFNDLTKEQLNTLKNTLSNFAKKNKIKLSMRTITGNAMVFRIK